MTAQARLFGGYYNSAGFSGANPGGLANGGHVQNFPAALQDIGVVAQDVGVKSAAATAAATAAAADAASANTSKNAAQAAAAAAATFDPATKANLSGATFTGTVIFSGANGGSVRMNPNSGANSSAIEFWGPGPTQRSYMINTGTQTLLVGLSGQTWGIVGGLNIDGQIPFTPTNDGSGSGLDADLLRGLAPASADTANTIVRRDSLGNSSFNALYAASFNVAGQGLSARDGATLQVSHAFYVAQGLSASVVTERSDRRLKDDIQPLEPSDRRLIPVSYVLKAGGEGRIGFIAQDVAEARSEAVRVGDDGVLEISAVALIAHLAEQLNRALDRLDAAGL